MSEYYIHRVISFDMKDGGGDSPGIQRTRAREMRNRRKNAAISPIDTTLFQNVFQTPSRFTWIVGSYLVVSEEATLIGFGVELAVTVVNIELF